MNALSDPQLLRAYAERRSEAAFAELVRRHIDLVHSAAVRMVNDPHLAKDVSQGVFVALAKDAGKLKNHPVLSGWLHRTARNIAAQTVRTDVRRRNRELQAAAMNAHPETDASWEEIAPHLDAALAELNDPDRDAVLLRYFENKPAQEMATILGITAEAAQKRVSRAVEKLRKNFAKRGLTAGGTGLASAISANAEQAAPAGLAAAVSSAVLTAALSGTAATTTKILAMTTLQKTLVAAAIAMLAGTAVYQVHRDSQARELTHSTPDTALSRERRQREGGSVVEQLAMARAAKPPVDRQKELERLKKRWLETKGPDGPENEARQAALARESVGLLLCSNETLQLLDFLEGNKLPGRVATQISSEVEELFKSPRAAEARKLLVGLPESVIITGQRSYTSFKGGWSEAWRDCWSKAAGKTCPDDEFEAFCAALNCKSCAQEALYGRNLTLMQVDPEAAFTSTLRAYQSGVPSLSGSEGLRELFMVELPPNTDFEKLERLLPSAEPLPEVRYALLRKWAEIDPAAAANHLISARDRLDPSLAGAIVSGSLKKNRSEIITLVSLFPEGPYFDYAVLSAASQPGILELVQKIQDPKMREEAMERVKEQLSGSQQSMTDGQ